MAAGTGRVGSRPAGYDRGSARLLLREEVEEAEEAARSLLPVDEEKVEASDRRDRHDEPEDEVVVELAVLVDMKDEAVELRPILGERMRTWQDNEATYANPWPGRTCAGSSAAGVLPAGPRCAASTPRVCLGCPPWFWGREPCAQLESGTQTTDMPTKQGCASPGD